MATVNEQVIKSLNHLIETCKDGENGFETAAKGVSMPDLKQLFKSYASQRGLFAGELQALVQRLGGKPETKGTVAATLHRGWISIKSLVASQDQAAIIAECEQGEDMAVKSYEETVKGGLPGEALELVQRQFAKVKEAHDRVRALKEVTVT